MEQYTTIDFQPKVFPLSPEYGSASLELLFTLLAQISQDLLLNELIQKRKLVDCCGCLVTTDRYLAFTSNPKFVIFINCKAAQASSVPLE